MTTKAQLEAENKLLREQNRNLRIFNKIIRNQLVTELNKKAPRREKVQQLAAERKKELYKHFLRFVEKGCSPEYALESANDRIAWLHKDGEIRGYKKSTLDTFREHPKIRNYFPK